MSVDVARAPKDLHIRANADRLRLVLINLLSNVVKYNNSDVPRIRIESRVVKETVQIDVFDNGGGATREEAAMIFEKSARGNRSGMEQGGGLGLPISWAIMRAMGGNLTVEFLQGGTSFCRLSLNCVDPPDRQ